MSQNAPRPGFIEDPSEHSLRILDELAEMNRRVCDQLLAQVIDDPSDAVATLLAHARLAREGRRAIALRDKIKAKTATRAAREQRR
jgi:hypothetical protein